MDKEQQIHEIILSYMAATNAHQERSQHHNGYVTISPEQFAQKYFSYFEQISSVLSKDTTR